MDELERIPPQAVDLEENILGVLILEKNSFFKVCDLLRPQVFYKEEHKEIYKAIEEMHQTGKPVDLSSLTEQLKSVDKLEDIGGAYFISTLTNKVASGANIEHHSRVITEKYLLRELIRLSQETQMKAFDPTTDVFQLQEEVITDLINIQNFVNMDNTLHVKDIIPKVIEEVEAANSEVSQIGIKSAFEVINRNFGGYVPKLFYIVAGRPGMGKSTFVRNEIHNFARQDISGIYFSLEMTKEQIVKSMVAADKEIPYDRLVRGGMHQTDWEKYHESLKEIESLDIFINESGKHTMQQIYLISKRMKLQNDIQYIIIDHVQLIKGSKDIYSKMCEVSAMCKEIAKELDIPVIGLSQLNREVEKRGDKVPQNSDLRESGTLEQDSDCIFLLYRPDYYDIQDNDGGSLEGQAKFINTKFRDGAIFDFKLTFEGNYQRFVEYDEIEPDNDIEPNERKDF